MKVAASLSLHTTLEQHVTLAVKVMVAGIVAPTGEVTVATLAPPMVTVQPAGTPLTDQLTGRTAGLVTWLSRSMGVNGVTWSAMSLRIGVSQTLTESVSSAEADAPPPVVTFSLAFQACVPGVSDAAV